MSQGLLLICVDLTIIAMMWWGSRSVVNPSKRETGYLLQTTMGSMGFLIVGALFIIIGLATMSMVVYV